MDLYSLMRDATAGPPLCLDNTQHFFRHYGGLCEGESWIAVEFHCYQCDKTIYVIRPVPGKDDWHLASLDEITALARSLASDELNAAFDAAKKAMTEREAVNGIAENTNRQNKDVA